MKEKIISDSYYGSLVAAVDKLSEREVSLGKRHILIVPDRCTLTAERMICDRFGGVFDVTVTTWSRLLRGKVSLDYLPKQGSVMLIRRILEEKKKELKCYKKSALARGFAAKLYESIGQLAVCEITPDEVRARGGERAEDIALVYSEYLRLTGGMYVDSAGKMKLLREYLEDSDFLSGATVYISCFDAYTKQMRNIIDVMERKSDGVYVFDTEAKYSFGDVEVYSASSPVLAAKEVTRFVINEMKSGIDASDICVVTSGSPDDLVRIMGENEVPYSAPVTLPLSGHPLGRFLSLALNLPIRGYRASDVVRLTKNPLSGADKSDSDALERYAARYGISYKLFLSPFTLGLDGSDGERELALCAERARGIAARIARFIGKGDVFGEIEDLIAYAETNCPDGLKREDEGRANPFEKARSLVSLCRDVMPSAPARVIIDSLLEGMSTLELAARPKITGAVEIGGERDFRARRFSRVIVADFDTDAHPSVTPDSGLISDEDIERLRALGTEISPTTAEVNRRARDEFFLLLSGAEKVLLVHTDKTGAALGAITPKAKNVTFVSGEQAAADLETAEDASSFLKACPALGMVTEQYLSVRAGLSENMTVPMYFPYAERLVGKTADSYSVPPPPVEAEEAGRLMLSDSTKVSQLETYFACPLKHFFRYGLKLKKPETGDLEPVDVGSLLHAVAENYIKIMDDTDPETAAKKLLAEAVEASGKSDTADPRTVEILSREAVGLCKAILGQIRAGSFRPVATEQEFGFEGSKLRGIDLSVHGKKIGLRGKIDRIDTCGKLARLIDYKTGSVKFRLGELKCGVKIQLLVYLAVLIRAGYDPAGAFYFSTLSDFGQSEPYLLTGVCANDEEVLAAVDPNIAERGESGIIKVKKSGKSFYVANRETMDDVRMLADYAVRIAEKAAEEISDGFISPSPYGGSSDACAYCEYSDACGYEGDKRVPPSAALHVAADKGE